MNKTVAKKILYETLGYHSDKGSELLFSCPACGHHKRKFSINLDKNVFKCWVCDYHGRNIRRVIRRFGSFTQLQKWDQIVFAFQLFSAIFLVLKTLEPLTPLILSCVFFSWHFGPWHQLYSLIFYSLSFVYILREVLVSGKYYNFPQTFLTL